MTSNILSAIPLGYDGRIVEVEGDGNRGLPSFSIVGMANKTIEESRDRVRSGLTNSGFSFPNHKVTINLAPAELRKDGTHLDLPIALSILTLSNQLLPTNTTNRLFAGELSLTGDLRPVSGIINIIETARRHNVDEIIIPYANLHQASLVPNIKILGAHNLREVFLYLKGLAPLKSATDRPPSTSQTPSHAITFDHIRAQQIAKRALSIAIAGRHNILLSGPPGSGKSMLARACASLLPDLSPEELLAVTKLHSLWGTQSKLPSTRPFRSPHHTSSTVSIVGGGAKTLPGEISLAHCGILLLDEFPEFRRDCLEALRQPLEDKTISISRIDSRVTYPADFMLIATMNPCPCGYLGSPTHQCTCTSTQILNYRKKLSGPILDRFDMFIEVPRADTNDLISSTTTSNEHLQAKNLIQTALSSQQKRYYRSDFFNSSLTSHQIAQSIQLSPPARQLLTRASDKLDLSTRAFFRIIRVAQTIADFESTSMISDQHIAEALQYRKRS